MFEDNAARVGGMDPGEVGLLRRAVGLCSRSAVAYKAAYMLTPEDGSERVLFERCTARYALLERLLGLLVEHSTPMGQVRDLLDGIDMDPARYQGRLEQALADASCSDEGLGRLAEIALAEDDLPAAIEACLQDQAAQVETPPEVTAPAAVVVAEASVARSARPRV